MELPMLGGHPPTQAYFDFFSAQELALAQAQRDRKAKAAESRRARPYTPRIISAEVSVHQIPLDLLDAPILRVGDRRLPLSLQELQEDMGDVYVDSPTGTETELTRDQWSDAAVAQLHEGLLHHSLAILSGRGNALEKAETLKWLFAPDVYDWTVTKHPSGTEFRRPVWAIEIPFTFQRCCALVGLNPQRLTEGLRHILQKAGLGQFLPE